MARFPIEYTLETRRGEMSPLEVHAGRRPAVMAGPPPEFGGDDGWWSPEHLLVAAAATCFAATFFSAAERANIPLGAYRCRAKGVLDRTPDGTMFTAIHLAVDLRVITDDVARARALVTDVAARCFVAQSLRCPVEVTADVVAS